MNEPDIELEAPIIVEKLSAFVKLRLNFAKQPITLLLDSGSMLTLISTDMLLDTVQIIRSSVIISGIAGSTHTISTKGAVFGGVLFEKTSVRFNFHLIDRAYALAGDGYLGLNFLLKFRAIINFHDDTIKFFAPANSHTQFDSSFPNTSQDFYDLEEIQPIRVDNVISKLNYDRTGRFDGAHTGRGILTIKCPTQGDYSCPECNGHYIHFVEKIGCNQNLSQDARILNIPNERNSFNSNHATINDNACHTNQIASVSYESPSIYHLAHAVLLGLETSLSDQNIDSNCNKLSHIAQMGNFLNFYVQKFTIFATKTEENFVYAETNESLCFDNPNNINVFTIWTQNAILNFSNSLVSTRDEFINKNLPLTHCLPEETQHIQEFVSEFSAQFRVEGDPLSKTDLIQHRINLKPNASPVCVKQFRIPQAHR